MDPIKNFKRTAEKWAKRNHRVISKKGLEEALEVMLTVLKEELPKHLHPEGAIRIAEAAADKAATKISRREDKERRKKRAAANYPAHQ